MASSIYFKQGLSLLFFIRETEMLDNTKIKSLLQQAKKEAFLMGFLPPEKVNIEISAAVETACWSFIPPHRIVVGNVSHNSKKSEGYIQSLLWHELSHARWTERDMKEVDVKLYNCRVPFKLYNLFEDARIEHLFRDETGKKFNWIQDIPNKEATTPVEIFYSFVNNEGVYTKEGANSFGDTIELRLLYVGKGSSNKNTIFSINNKGEYDYNHIKTLLKSCGYELGGVFYTPGASVAKSNIIEDSMIKSKAAKAHGGVNVTTPDGKFVELVSYETKDNSKSLGRNRIRILSVNLAGSMDATFDKVADYYKRACNAQNSMEIIDICAEWLKEFPESYRDELLNNYEQGSRGRGKSKGDLISPEDMENIAGESISGDENGKSLEEEAVEMLSKGSLEGLGTLYGSPETFDETRLNRLTQLFKGIIKRGMVKYNSIVPSKRLNIRNYTLGSDKIFKKTQYENGKSEKLSVILDCSGSMSGSHLYAGKEFLIIVNRLAKQGLIRGNIILTESLKQVLLPMPVDEKIIHSIRTGGGEGFKTTIKKYGKVLQESEKVFIFTDGEIGDEPDSDYNRKLGIKTYGLYVGETDQTEQLRRYFDEAISKTSLEDVINELLKIVK